MKANNDLDAFVDAYIECALWSSLDDKGEPLDGTYDDGDIADTARADMVSECTDFVNGNAADLATLDAGQCGHDFWLTRNGHGTGFWDRGYGDLGDRLSKAAEVYGESDLYVGDDGQLYVTVQVAGPDPYTARRWFASVKPGPKLS